MNIGKEVERLLQYGVKNGLIDKLDVIQKRNELMDLLRVEEPYEREIPEEEFKSPVDILNKMLDYCVEKKIIPRNTVTYRDLMDTKIMGLLVDRQSNIIKRFRKLQKESPKKATDYFYSLCKASNYIRTDRVRKNLEWENKIDIGNMKITINMSKPELDAKEVARMKEMPQSKYPKCFLCPENVGYAGRLNYPARQNHRVIPVMLGDEQWYFQYSPYVYYNEHCILFNEEHRHMLVKDKTFVRMFDFVDQFPHYFIGSNAGLPIIGGSILSHDHYQGGRENFPIEKAPYKIKFKHSKYLNVKIGIIKWPLGTLRIESLERQKLQKICTELLHGWQKYHDESMDIIPYSSNKGEIIHHNGITPIVRKNKDGKYVVHIVFRNNRTSNEYPDGIFHPHKGLHHIKKEGIGVIEVMGQAILPGRLNNEFEQIKNILCGKSKFNIDDLEDEYNELYKHRHWINEMVKKYGTQLNELEAQCIVHKEVTDIYLKILSDAGVFKYTEEGLKGFVRFLKTLGIEE